MYNFQFIALIPSHLDANNPGPQRSCSTSHCGRLKNRTIKKIGRDWFCGILYCTHEYQRHVTNFLDFKELLQRIQLHQDPLGYQKLFLVPRDVSKCIEQELVQGWFKSLASDILQPPTTEFEQTLSFGKTSNQMSCGSPRSIPVQNIFMSELKNLFITLLS